MTLHKSKPFNCSFSISYGVFLPTWICCVVEDIDKVNQFDRSLPCYVVGSYSGKCRDPDPDLVMPDPKHH